MKKIIYIIMMLFFTGLLVYSIRGIFNWYKDNNETDEVTNDINNEVIEIEQIVDDNNEVVSVKKINFDKLKNKNSDTVGWINVPSTNIDYPFVKTKDNSFYLNHSFDKKYNDAGWIFMDYQASNNFKNKNTVIYGHARLDLSMFGTLRYTMRKNWYKNDKNHIIKITLPKEVLTYKVFSTYHIKTENYYIKNSFDSDEEFLKFVNTLKKRSIYNFNVNLDKSDQILTLSSCYSEKEKVVLHAKLLSRSES